MAIEKFRNAWRAYVYVDGKKVMSKSGFKNKTEAKAWHDRQKANFNPAKVEKKKKTAFEVLLTDFETLHLPTIKPETKRRYLVDINYRIQPFFQFYPLEQLKSIHFERFKVKIMSPTPNGSTLTPKSINNCLGLLHLLFEKAVEWGYLVKNVCSIKTLPIPQQDYTWWEDPNDIGKFLAVAKENRNFAAHKLALETGMRLGEIIGLSKKDVNFDRLQIKINRQWSDKQASYCPTKNSKIRVVPIDRELAKLLKEAILASPDKEIIFVTKTGNRLRCDKLRDQFKRLIKKAQVPDIRFHDMRHTFASHYMISVGDIWTLKQILGHSSITTTERYAHLSANHLKGKAISFSGPITHKSPTFENFKVCKS